MHQLTKEVPIMDIERLIVWQSADGQSAYTITPKKTIRRQTIHRQSFLSFWRKTGIFEKFSKILCILALCKRKKVLIVRFLQTIQEVYKKKDSYWFGPLCLNQWRILVQYPFYPCGLFKRKTDEVMLYWENLKFVLKKSLCFLSVDCRVGGLSYESESDGGL